MIDSDVLIECVIERLLREHDVTIKSGEEVKFGSLAHVKDLRSVIADLERHRDTQKRGSDARATYARAILRLKLQLKKALAASQPRNV